MNNKLFKELLESTKEMVDIENGKIIPDLSNIHYFSTQDVNAIRNKIISNKAQNQKSR